MGVHRTFASPRKGHSQEAAMARGRVSDLRKSSFLLSKGCAAFRGRGHRRHERHAEARPTCHLCSFSDSLLGKLMQAHRDPLGRLSPVMNDNDLLVRMRK